MDKVTTGTGRMTPEMRMGMMDNLGFQDGGKCSDMYVMSLHKFGLDAVRLRNDITTQHDLKNALIVWSFQLCLCYYVVIKSDNSLEDIYKTQLEVNFGVTRLITSIVMHVLM